MPTLLTTLLSSFTEAATAVVFAIVCSFGDPWPPCPISGWVLSPCVAAFAFALQLATRRHDCIVHVFHALRLRDCKPIHNRNWCSARDACLLTDSQRLIAPAELAGCNSRNHRGPDQLLLCLARRWFRNLQFKHTTRSGS